VPTVAAALKIAPLSMNSVLSSYTLSSGRCSPEIVKRHTPSIHWR
jgi:hypothetical protein